MAKPKIKGQQALAAAMKKTEVKTKLAGSRSGRPALLAVGRSAVLPKRQTKHHNNITFTAEGKFDSDAEYRRWVILKLLQQARKIFALKRQVRIPFRVNKEQLGYYVADFVYCPRDVAIVFSPKWGFVRDAVVEDVKGHPTELYKWKRAHFKAEYGFVITEVKA